MFMNLENHVEENQPPSRKNIFVSTGNDIFFWVSYGWFDLIYSDFLIHYYLHDQQYVF